MEEFFIQLAVILFTAFIVAYIAKSLKQPIIIGYILAGIIISPFIFRAGASQEVIQIFSNLGIAFLLFIVGLHLNPRVIKEVGLSSLLVAAGQIILTFAVGFLASLFVLKWDLITSVYVGIALAFSSTIIVMKLLSDSRQLESLYGKISIGILIIQDVVAVAALMLISSISNGSDIQSLAIRSLVGGTGLIIVLFLLGFAIIPRVTKNIAKSQELLFLFSICWCFIIAALFSYFGFSIEIGALIAGVVLSTSPYSTEISARIRPLRDFFLIIFFIILGLNIQVTNLNSIMLNAVILSCIALLLKPIIIMFFMAIFGYTKRTNFFTGITLAQISEFSFILLTIGVAMGHISGEVLSTLTLTGVITITLSTYMVIYSNDLYKKTFRFVSVFEKRNIHEQRKIQKQYDAILFGYNRIGFSILNSLKRIKKNYLVIDFNPDTIANLNKFKIPCIYGDSDDQELLRELPLDKIDLAISTIPDFETNYLLIESIRMVNPKAIIIVRAHEIASALELYRKGASYVLTPHFLGGEYVSNMIDKIKTNESKYKEEKEKHIKMLRERAKKGHEHPEVERN